LRRSADVNVYVSVNKELWGHKKHCLYGELDQRKYNSSKTMETHPMKARAKAR